MAGWIPTRLRNLLGLDLDAVTSDRIQRLMGLVEDTDLEFKSEPYGVSEGQRKELAYDLAGMANAIGGIVFVGVSEDGNGRATAVAGIDPGHDLAAWIDQVVAERIRPRPSIAQRSIAVEQLEVHIISVEPSTLAPFAVSIGDGGLRYPLRNGSIRTWLHEPDIAERYRRRFAATREVDEQLSQIHEEAAGWVPHREMNDPFSWLVVSLVPDVSGYLALQRGIAESWQEWLRPALRSFPPVGRGVVDVQVGFRSLSFTDLAVPRGAERLYTVGGQLNVDGSGMIVFGSRGSFERVDQSLCAVFDEHVIGDLIKAVGVLSNHAIRTGAAGYGQLGAEIQCRTHPMVLAHYRGGLVDGLIGSRIVRRSTGLSRHSAPLEAASVPGMDLISVARSIAVDLVSAFGFAEPQQITASNQLVRLRFQTDWHEQIERWSHDSGVELIDNYQGGD